MSAGHRTAWTERPMRTRQPELDQRIRGLHQALAQQTARTDVLKVISGSPADTQGFHAIVENPFANALISIASR